MDASPPIGTSGPRVFASPNLLWSSLVWLVLFAFACGVSYVLASLIGWTSGVVSLAIGAAICGLGEYLALTQLSDVVIDEKGISRSLFGKTWRSIRWVDLREIVAFMLPRFGGRPRRAYRFYQSLEPRFIRPNTIVISSDFGDVAGLFEDVKSRVERYGLKITITIDSKVATVDQLIQFAASSRF